MDDYPITRICEQRHRLQCNRRHTVVTAQMKTTQVWRWTRTIIKTGPNSINTRQTPTTTRYLHLLLAMFTFVRTRSAVSVTRNKPTRCTDRTYRFLSLDYVNETVTSPVHVDRGARFKAANPFYQGLRASVIRTEGARSTPNIAHAGFNYCTNSPSAISERPQGAFVSALLDTSPSILYRHFCFLSKRMIFTDWVRPANRFSRRELC